MPTMRAWLFIGLLAALFAPARSAEGETVERTIEVAGTTRSYVIHVPAGWDKVGPLPVLFVFHGAGSDAESMVRATGFNALAEAAPMLVVYPRAPAAVRRYEVDPPAGRVSADVLLVDALLARLRERFPVDARRIWATGFSNGAALCYRLAAERPRVVAAIAPVAGYLPDLVRTAPVVPVPLLHVHGTADGRVGAPDGAGSVAETWARWNGATRAAAEQRVLETGTLVLRRRTWSGPTPRSDAELLLVEGKGHEWSGGPGGAVSRRVLAFFAAHPHEEVPMENTPAEPQRPPPKVNVPANPLLGQPLGSLAALRWLTPDGRPFALADQRLTLFRWWTNECAHCQVSVPPLADLEQRYRARGLRMVAVYHPKGARLGDAQAKAYAQRLGFDGTLAFDDAWTKYKELRDRGGLRPATSISVLVDADGIVRWVHPGPRIRPGSAELATLDAVVDGLLR